MSAPGDMDIEQGILNPEAAKKQVSHITSSGYDFLPRDAPISNLNIKTPLKLLCFNNYTRYVIICSKSKQTNAERVAANRKAAKEKEAAKNAKRREKHIRDGDAAHQDESAAGGGGAPFDAADNDVEDSAPPAARNQGY